MMEESELNCTCVNDDDLESDSSESEYGDEDIKRLSINSNSSSIKLVHRLTSNTRDPMLASTAFHNSEALRHARSLPNVFCACYDTDMVIMLVHLPRGNDGSLSPVQEMLLEPDNISTVFRYATSLVSKRKLSSPDSKRVIREAYRKAYIATEIILRFYLRIITWETKASMFMSSPSSNFDGFETEDAPTNPRIYQSRFITHRQSVGTTSDRPVFSRDASSSGRGRQFGRNSTASSNGSSTPHSSLNTPTLQRGYVLFMYDLPESEWREIFRGMYEFLNLKIPHQSEEFMEIAVDQVMVAHMCRLTKYLVVEPAIHAILCSSSENDDETVHDENIFSILSNHLYNSEIVSLYHGLLHLSRRRGINILPMVNMLVKQVKKFSHFPFSSLKPLRHARISGCIEILVNMLREELPNTFRFFRQAMCIVGSYERVEQFEKAMMMALPEFGNSSQENNAEKVGSQSLLEDTVFQDLKQAVQTCLLQDKETLLQFTTLGLAELTFLDSMSGVQQDKLEIHFDGIPTTLILDLLKNSLDVVVEEKRGASDNSKARENLRSFLVAIDLLVEPLCASINYPRYHNTLEEYAARGCFSDDDEDDEEDDSSLIDSKITKLDVVVQPVKAPQYEVINHINSGGLNSPVFPSSPVHNEAASTKASPPLSSPLLILHVVELLESFIAIRKDAMDARLAKLGTALSMVHLFEKFPKANILHCRLVKFFLTLFDRAKYGTPLTTGTNNALLRQTFRPPTSLPEFIMSKLHKSKLTHAYDPHLAILGVKIDKICHAPSNQQEIIRQYCSQIKGWETFSGSLVAYHYQQTDALSDLNFTSQGSDNAKATTTTKDENSKRLRNGGVTDKGKGGSGQKKNRSQRSKSSPSSDEGDVLAFVRPKAMISSSSSSFLTQELEPFRRMPLAQTGTGFGSDLVASANSSQEGASDTVDDMKSRHQSSKSHSTDDRQQGRVKKGAAVRAVDMIHSRSRSQFPQSIVEILRGDAMDSFVCELSNGVLKGHVYQKRSKWVKVVLEFHINTCELSLRDSSLVPSEHSADMEESKNESGTAMTKWKYLWRVQKAVNNFQLKNSSSNSLPRVRLLVGGVRNWIVFGRSVKNPDVGAFGFQMDIFDRLKEEDETLTFITRSEDSRLQWVTTISNALNSFTLKARSESINSPPQNGIKDAPWSDNEVSEGSKDATKRIAAMRLTSRHSFGDEVDDEQAEANQTLIESVTFVRQQDEQQRESIYYLCVPSIELLQPVLDPNFRLESEVPEELPFWGKFYGESGVKKYSSLFQACLRVVKVKLKSIRSEGYSVVVEFDATLQSVVSLTELNFLEATKEEDLLAPGMITTCSCTDTYLVSGGQILRLTRTIVDSEKLLHILMPWED